MQSDKVAGERDSDNDSSRSGSGRRSSHDEEKDDDDAPPIEIDRWEQLPKGIMRLDGSVKLLDDDSFWYSSVRYFCNECSEAIPPTMKRFRCWECYDFDICDRCRKELGHPHRLSYERLPNESMRRRVVLRSYCMRNVLEKAYDVYRERPALGYRPHNPDGA